MTPKHTSRECAQGWMAAEGLAAAAKEAAGDALAAARRLAGGAAGAGEMISPGPAPRPRRLVNGTWTGGELSSGGASLETLARGMDLSDVRLEKVLRLRQAIASGRYRVSAADVADKLIGAFTFGSGLKQRS